MLSLFTLFLWTTSSFSVSLSPQIVKQTNHPTANWQDKVDSLILKTISQDQAEFLVFLSQQADLSHANLLKTKLDKGRYVYEQLTRTARITQEPLLESLVAREIQHQSFWVANMIWVRGDASLVQELALREDVAHLYANPSVLMRLPQPAAEPPFSANAPSAVEWNIMRVNADDVWSLGYTGQGAVVGGQDTGYDWDHPALIRQYRGWDGALADHNYHWHDAIHSVGNQICVPNSTEPCDDYGHGTHTMGTMVGDDGGSNQIGMAPGAKWIGCRNMDRGIGTPATYSECYQWFIAPTDLNDQNPRPDLAPDVINNSWSCPVSEGCTDLNVLLAVVENVRAAGILTVHSAGNYGPSCGSVFEPAAIYDASFSIGATDYYDLITAFSSRGPVAVDGSNRLKPDVSAPGQDIRSSGIGGTYYPSQGTSMAAPHVAGMAALLISAQPGLAGHVDMLEALITENALPLPSTQSCGNIQYPQVPNNISGWGRIDALASTQAALDTFEIIKSPSTFWARSGDQITFTIHFAHHYPLPMTGVVLYDTLPANTTFVNATAPYSFDGQTVQWDISSLEPNQVQQVQLTVQLPASGLWTITNHDYGNLSDQVSSVIIGSPVTVMVAEAIFFLPLVSTP